MHLTTLFIDLDDTVYPADSGVWRAIRQRIDQYVAEKFSLVMDQARERRQQLFLRYGTTMRGLQAEYHIDEDEYLAYVHDVPLHQFISPNPELAQMLRRYPQRKWIFTNADSNHARRVLAILGIGDCFEEIIDIKRTGPYCKPMPEAFAIALAAAGSPAPASCVLVDDHAGNVQAARALGLRAVRVGAPDPALEVSIASLLELPSVLPYDGGRP